MTLQELAQNILNACRRVLGTEQIYLNLPRFEHEEFECVQECMKTGWVSSAGPFVTQFEEKLKEITKAKHVISLVNGTAALHLALKNVGVEPNHEVIVPNLTFVGTGHAVMMCGAIPHLCDIHPDHLGLNANQLKNYLAQIVSKNGDRLLNKKTGRIISAIVVVHMLGFPAEMSELLAVADEFNLPVVEDAAQGLGSFINKKHVGLFGRCGILSFNGNKIITTAGGGALMTDDDELAKRVRHQSTTAKVPHSFWYDHDELGFNYRMPALNAALGVGQLKHLPTYLSKKRQLSLKYVEAFSHLSQCEFFLERSGTSANHWLPSFKINGINRSQLEFILDFLNKNGIQTRALWSPLNRFPHFKDCPQSDLNVSLNFADQVISLPCSPYLVDRMPEVL